MKIIPFVLAGVVLSACMPAGYVDITVALKEMNQRIAPAALFCPELAYPPGSEVTCTVEGMTRYHDVSVLITENGIEFADPEAARQAIQFVTEDM